MAGNTRDGARERRARYAELRRQGLKPWDALVGIGMTGGENWRRYERWYQAELRGETFLTGRDGGDAV